MPTGDKVLLLLAAKVACCVGLALAATGALSVAGLAGWFFDGGIAWLVGAALAVTVLYVLRQGLPWRQSKALRDQSAQSRSVTPSSGPPSTLRPERHPGEGRA